MTVAVASVALGAGASFAAYSSPPRHGGCAHRSSFRERSGGRGGCTPHRPRGTLACHGTQLGPTPRNTSAIRSAVFCLVNRERLRRGEEPLRPNMRLRRAAQGHSESMAAGGYFDHVSPGGATPLARMRAVGYISGRTRGYEVGENIGWGTLWKATPQAIVAAWMASPGHRANILDPRFRDTAVGVAAHLPRSLSGGQSGAVYTQDFGVRSGG
jgi:uncharacterized protein YkwD